MVFILVIDVETAGFNAKTDALLEIAAITLKMDEQGWLDPDTTYISTSNHLFGANLQPEALAFNGIDPNDPDRGAVSEYRRCTKFLKLYVKVLKRAAVTAPLWWRTMPILITSFMMAAAERASLKRNPFHPFATFDTAALAGLALGQTVLSKACQTAGMDFDSTQAHSALYDTERTAVLFCEIVQPLETSGRLAATCRRRGVIESMPDDMQWIQASIVRLFHASCMIFTGE
ncbi:ribonuclease T [Escherichia coli]|nr:ribonuclease T [Escherichia coli]